MNGMKYITFKGMLHNEIVIFMSNHDHAVFAARMDIDIQDVIGAGFIACDIDNPEPRCVGKSTSLYTVADPGDTKLLHRALNWNS